MFKSELTHFRDIRVNLAGLSGRFSRMNSRFSNPFLAQLNIWLFFGKYRRKRKKI